MKVQDFQLNTWEWPTILSENNEDDTCLCDSQECIILPKVGDAPEAIGLGGWGSLFLCHIALLLQQKWKAT